MIREIRTNLFDLQVDALAHGCNTQGIMHAGIAKVFKEKYPKMFKEYKSYCQNGLFQPGEIHFYRNPLGKPHIINIATQFDLKTGANLEYIEKGLREIETHYSQWEIQSLGLPRIGCQLGKLFWRDVKPLIYDVFSDSKLEVIVAYQ